MSRASTGSRDSDPFPGSGRGLSSSWGVLVEEAAPLVVADAVEGRQIGKLGEAALKLACDIAEMSGRIVQLLGEGHATAASMNEDDA